MKFLLMFTVTDSCTLVPPTVMRQVLEADVAWVEEQKRAGKILEVYFCHYQRAVAICEHPSAEDLAQTLAQCPMAGFVNVEVYPLADFGQAMKANIEALKVAEALFPAAPK